MLEDPYPHYANLQREHPIFWHEGMQSWILTRYQDCRQVLRDHELWSPTVGDVPKLRQNLQTLDPPAQAPLRSLLVNSLRSQDFTGIGRRARTHIQELFRTLGRRQSFDWMTEVASPVALSMTADLIGVQEPDHDAYVQISEGIARRMDAGLRPENAEFGDRAREKLNTLADGWFASEAVSGTLECVKANAAKAQVPVHLIHNSLGMLFNASYGTIFATAGNVALTLIKRPEVLGTLRDERLLTTGVDELIRFDGPAQGTSRIATRDTEIRGTTLKRGQTVMTALAAANRDPDEFPNPHEIILDRTPNRHLAFGWGVHGCVGAMFGQLAIKELISCLLAAPYPLRLAGKPVRRHTATVRSMQSMPVTLGRE